MPYQIDLPQSPYAYRVTRTIPADAPGWAGPEVIAVTLELRWLPLLGSWMYGVAVDGVEYVVGRRVSPSAQLLSPDGLPWTSTMSGIPGLAGAFVWWGADPYTQSDMGTSVLLYYMTPTEAIEAGFLEGA